MVNNKEISEIYRFTEDFLKKITPEEVILEKYLFAKPQKYTLAKIAARLFSSLQNSQSMPNVIAFQKNNKKFASILKGFNPSRIIDFYNCEDELYDEFVKNFTIKNAESPKNLWRRYAKSCFSASKFLSLFHDSQDFLKFVDQFSHNNLTEIALPTLLEKEIYGLGFALACDFLKELGFENYAKPDVHLKEIFYKLNLAEHNDYAVFKAVANMARINEVTAYRVDKIFWLISSGNYYYDNVKIPSNKQVLLQALWGKGHLS